jgi:kynureninase
MPPNPPDRAPSHELSLDYARARDEADPLAQFRGQFALPVDRVGAPLLYMCGHSLGLMPLAARDLMTRDLDDWARMGVRAHTSAHRPFIYYHDYLRDDLASLIGCQSEEVVAMNSLTINLHLMMASLFRPRGRRKRILIEAGAFSSDRHAVASQLAWHGLDERTHLIELAPAAGEDLVPEEAIEAILQAQGDDIALVLWPGVQFRTGQSFDLPRIAKAGRLAGAMVGFDLAHTIGNLPVALHDTGADFAVWCSYKYLNAGPGAIGGCFIHPRHFDSASRLSGWWGHDIATRFDMGPQFNAAPGAAGFHVSNQSVFSAAPLAASLAMFREAGMQRLRDKSCALTGFLEALLARHASELTIVTPREQASRGAQLSLRIGGGRGRRVFDWLTEREVVCDWRAPDIVRVAPIPLYNTFEDVFHLAERLGQALRDTR